MESLVVMCGHWKTESRHEVKYFAIGDTDKGRCARDALPHTVDIGVLKFGKIILPQ